MTDTELLKKTIKESGKTMVAISKQTGILRESLYNKVNGKSEFLASEILEIRKALNLSKKQQEDIFFKEKRE